MIAINKLSPNSIHCNFNLKSLFDRKTRSKTKNNKVIHFKIQVRPRSIEVSSLDYYAFKRLNTIGKRRIYNAMLNSECVNFKVISKPECVK